MISIPLTEDLLFELGFACFEGLLAFGCYKAYRYFLTVADTMEKLPVYEVGSELRSAVSQAPGKCLPYVGIYGTIKASKGSPLQDLYPPMTGLIRRVLVTKPKIEINEGVWTTVKRGITFFEEACNFGILLRETNAGDPSTLVEVNHHLQNENLLHLPVVMNTVEEINKKIVVMGLNEAKGEIIKGHELEGSMLLEDVMLLDESLLLEGTRLLGLGKVCLSHLNGTPELIIGPPDSGHQYILTICTKSEVVTNAISFAKFFKILFYAIIILGVIKLVSLIEFKKDDDKR